MMGKRRTGHSGQSIVEILVAMVVLLIGIFGIARIFPTGFGLIRYGEHSSKATRMAHAALEYARANAENLPDAVVAVDARNGFLDGNLTSAVENHDLLQQIAQPAPPASTFPLSFFGPVPPNSSFFASYFGFNRTRRIYGETTKVPPPTANVLYMPLDPQSGQRELVSVYTLKYGPLYSDTKQQPGVGGVVVYSGRTMERVVFSQDPAPEDVQNLSFQRYGVNYRTQTLYLAPRPYPRRYRLVYSYVVRDGQGFFRAQSAPDFFFDLPAGVASYKIQTPPSATLEPGEEQVSRAYNRIPLGQLFSNQDPYEYKLLNSFVGIIGFNPLGTVVRRGGPRGSLAKIDYDVDDWHILAEDRTIPQDSPHRIRLTQNFIKAVGTIDENQVPYTALMRTIYAPGSSAGVPDDLNRVIRPSPTPNIDLIVVDLDTGATIDSRTLQSDVSTGGNSLNGAIDYRTGVIHFNPLVQWSLPPNGNLGPAESIGGKHVRIYYRTEDDMGLQVEKAFTSYLRSALPTTVTPGQYGQLPDGFLLFPASDHNQSVLIDYSFTDAGSGRRLTVSGELQPIRDPVTDPASPQNLIPGIFSGLSVPQREALYFVRLNNSPRISAGDPAGRANVAPGTIAIQSVRGVSVRARVAWRESQRWRRIENSTYLTRQGT